MTCLGNRRKLLFIIIIICHVVLNIYISVCLFGCDYVLTLPNREAFPPLLASLESPQQNGVNIVVFLIFGLTKQKLLGLECI